MKFKLTYSDKKKLSLRWMQLKRVCKGIKCIFSTKYSYYDRNPKSLTLFVNALLKCYKYPEKLGIIDVFVKEHKGVRTYIVYLTRPGLLISNRGTSIDKLTLWLNNTNYSKDIKLVKVDIVEAFGYEWKVLFSESQQEFNNNY